MRNSCPSLRAKPAALQKVAARLLCSAALTLFVPIAANANPQNGKVAAGSATISQSGANTVNVNQQSQKAIINWQSFSIATGQTTNFIQPDASAITLNRVTGVDPSSIMGNLTANGQIWLINPNGIAFSKSARVDVAGLLATTIDIADQDFLGGNYKFSGLANTGAMVTNAGKITVRDAGLAALVAPGVANSGVIEADLGQIQLSSSAAFTIDFYGDGLFNFTLDKQVTQAIKNADGTQPTAAVTNSGKLIADGGRIALTANVASSVVSNAINMSGYAQATSATVSNGQIVLDGGNDGTVEVAGNLNASGTQSGLTGGTVEVTGNNVNVSSSAKLNASGTSGGSIRIVSRGATSISGSVLASNTSGTGGTIETSGHTLSIGGKVDAGTGSWLLDPYDLTVGSSAASTINASLGAGTSVTLQTTATGTSGPGTTNASGSGDIIIGSAINWGTSATLTLDAYSSINILAPITVSGAGGIVLKTNDGGSGGDYSFGLGVTGFLGSVSFTGTPDSGQSLTINGRPFTLLYTIGDVQSINSNLSGDYALASSLNASSIPNWTPIGYSTAATANGQLNGINATPAQFVGIFEGLGHTISSIVIDKTTSFNLGLFSLIGSAGMVQNFGLTGGSLTASGDTEDFGLLAGWNWGTIKNVYSTGAIDAGDGTAKIGDLVGWNWNGGLIINSYATGNVTAGNNTGDVGGLVGSQGYGYGDGGTIAGSYATGNVSGGNNSSSVGGLVGENNSSVIRDSFATGNISSASGSSALGGLAGSSNGYWGGELITGSYATGSVTGSADSTWLGGLIGIAIWASTTSNSYATGNVTGGSYVGGLIGWNGYTITQFIGSNISTSYATGRLSGSNNVGGLVGFNNAGTISDSYWDTQTTGATTGIGGDNNNQSANVVGLPTTQLKSGLPYGFDPSVWAISSSVNHGYPYLLALSGQVTLTPVSWSVGNATSTYGTLATLGHLTLNGVSTNDLSNVSGTISLFSDQSLTDPVTLSAGLNAGTYYEAVTGLTGSAAGNYTLSSSGDVVGTLTIDPESLTVTANNLSRYLGQPNPSLTYTITMGTLFGGYPLPGALATSATASSPKGTYAITQGSLAASNNYALTFVPGTLTVSASPSQQQAISQTTNQTASVYTAWQSLTNAFSNTDSVIAQELLAELDAVFGGSTGTAVGVAEEETQVAEAIADYLSKEIEAKPVLLTHLDNVIGLECDTAAETCNQSEITQAANDLKADSDALSMLNLYRQMYNQLKGMSELSFLEGVLEEYAIKYKGYKIVQ